VSGLQAAGIVVLLTANGFFVGAEFALISARRTQVEPLASGGSRRARVVLTAMGSAPTMLAGAQLGVTVASLGLGALGKPAIAHALRPLLRAAGLPAGLTHPVAFAFALALVVSGHIILGEMVPKNLALASPERAALWLVPPLRAFTRATRPLLTVVTVVTNAVLRLTGIPPAAQVRTIYTPDELPVLIDESREHRLLDADEHDRMIATLALQARPVSTVMVPLDQVVTVPTATTAATLQEQAARHGYSRFPVRGDQPGQLRGYLHVLDALNGRPPGSPLPPRTLPHLPSDTALSDVLATMRDRRAQLAAVTGTAGAAIGVATLQDVLTGLLHPLPSHSPQP
jgi:CBS domain containing-hemolysin-like protein